MPDFSSMSGTNPSTRMSVSDKVAIILEVDVAARDDGNDWTLTGLTRQRGRERQRPRAFADDACLSAMSRIASFVSSRLTTMQPSTTPSIRSHMRGRTLRLPAPSTNDDFRPLNTCGDPILNESAVGAAVSGSAPRKSPA